MPQTLKLMQELSQSFFSWNLLSDLHSMEDKNNNIVSQSFFSWNLLSDRDAILLLIKVYRSQSFFSWNLLSDSYLNVQVNSFVDCLSPSFLGTYSLTYEVVAFYPYTSWSQSFFSWNLLSDRYRLQR